MTAHERVVTRLRAHCLAKPGTTEELPFDDRTLVFKVGGKMFCLLDAFEFEGCGMKCAPERIPELRAQFEGVTTGPYLNAKHWNSVHPEPFGDVPWETFLDLVDHSYALVWQGLTKKVKLAIEEPTLPLRIRSFPTRFGRGKHRHDVAFWLARRKYHTSR